MDTKSTLYSLIIINNIIILKDQNTNENSFQIFHLSLHESSFDCEYLRKFIFL